VFENRNTMLRKTAGPGKGK